MHATPGEVQAPQATADDDPDTSDMPLHRAGAPRPYDASFDRVVTFLQPLGKALQGLLRTGGGALEPGIERRRLPLAHERRKVLRQVDRLGGTIRNRGQVRGLARRAHHSSSYDAAVQPPLYNGLPCEQVHPSYPPNTLNLPRKCQSSVRSSPHRTTIFLLTVTGEHREASRGATSALAGGGTANALTFGRGGRLVAGGFAAQQASGQQPCALVRLIP